MAEKPELDILNPLPFNAAKKGKKESRILDATDLFIVLVIDILDPVFDPNLELQAIYENIKR